MGSLERDAKKVGWSSIFQQSMRGNRVYKSAIQGKTELMLMNGT